MTARDPEQLAIDQMVDDALARARASNVNDRDTDPEIQDYEIADVRSWRVRLADWMESIGTAIAAIYWGVVRRVRGGL